MYVNANKPLAVDIPEIAALFPSDDDDDGQAAAVARPDRVKRDIGAAERRQLASEGRAVTNPDGHISFPVGQGNHKDAENALALIRSGHGDVRAAKRMLRRVAVKEGWSDIVDALDGMKGGAKKSSGNPAPHPSGGSWTDRLSPSRVTGQAAPSTGDHNAAAFSDPMNQPGPRALALGHPDLRQSNTNFNDVIARLRTVNGDDQNGDRSVTYTAGEVGLSLFNARGAAGAYPGMQPVGHSPQRDDWHQARGSATPPNGPHGAGNPASRPPLSGMKSSEAREIMRRHMFPGSGGAR